MCRIIANIPFKKCFIYIQQNGTEQPEEKLQKKNELINDISNAIDELSNLKSMRQLAKEKMKAQELSREMEKRAKVQEYRLEQANMKMSKIEAVERDKCRKTAALMKEFEDKCGKAPFFKGLFEILLNFQGYF